MRKRFIAARMVGIFNALCTGFAIASFLHIAMKQDVDWALMLMYWLSLSCKHLMEYEVRYEEEHQ